MRKIANVHGVDVYSSEGYDRSLSYGEVRKSDGGGYWTEAIRAHAIADRSRGIHPRPVLFCGWAEKELKAELAAKAVQSSMGCTKCRPHGKPGYVPGFLGEIYIPCECASG